MSNLGLKNGPRSELDIKIVHDLLFDLGEARGDVHPFLAIAMRLQEYGQHVRLATYDNLNTVVLPAGADFCHLGGDPLVLAGYMVRNKGLTQAGLVEISIQRKKLKVTIDSLLPACTSPDLETGIAFRPWAIISDPLAYGHRHVAEVLGAPFHIFTMPEMPTYKFPDPLACVLQSEDHGQIQDDMEC